MGKLTSHPRLLVLLTLIVAVIGLNWRVSAQYSGGGGIVAGTPPGGAGANCSTPSVSYLDVNGHYFTCQAPPLLPQNQKVWTQVTSPLSSKGDLWVFGTQNTRLGIGTNQQVLTADSTASNGMKWADSSVVTATPPYLTINGSSYSPAFLIGIPVAASSGWTWANQSTSTVTTLSSGALAFAFKAANGSTNLRAFTRALPASTGYTAIIGVVLSSADIGLCITDGTKFVAFYQIALGSWNFDTWNNTTSRAASTNTAGFMSGPIIWMRVQDTGGTRSFYFSSDGVTWTTFSGFQQATATFLTETSVGVCFETNQGLDPGNAQLLDFRTSVP